MSTTQTNHPNLTSFLRITPFPVPKEHDPSFFADKNDLHVAAVEAKGGMNLTFAAPGTRVDMLKRTMSNVASRRRSMRRLSEARGGAASSNTADPTQGKLSVPFRGAFDPSVNDETVCNTIAAAVAPQVAQRQNVTLVFVGPSGSGKSSLAKQAIPAILAHLGLKATLLLAEENHSEQLVFGTLKPVPERVKLLKNQHKHGLLLETEQAAIAARRQKLLEQAEQATADQNAAINGSSGGGGGGGSAGGAAAAAAGGGEENNQDVSNADAQQQQRRDVDSPTSNRRSPSGDRRHSPSAGPDHRYELLVYAPPPRNRIMVLPDAAGADAGAVAVPGSIRRSATPAVGSGGSVARSLAGGGGRSTPAGSHRSSSSVAAGSPTRSVFSIAKLRRPFVEASPQVLIPRLVDDDDAQHNQEQDADEENKEEDDAHKGMNHPMFDALKEVHPQVTEPESVFHLKKNGRDALMHPAFKAPTTGPLKLPNNRMVDVALGDQEGGLGLFVWLRDSGEQVTEPSILFDSLDTVDRSYNIRITLHGAEADRYEAGALCISIRDFHSKKLEVVFQEVCTDKEWHSYQLHIQPAVNLATLAVDGAPTRKRVVFAENPMTFFPERLKVSTIGAVSTKSPDGTSDVVSGLFIGSMYLFTLFDSKTSKIIQQFPMTPDSIIVPEEKAPPGRGGGHGGGDNKPGMKKGVSGRMRRDKDEDSGASPPPPGRAAAGGPPPPEVKPMLRDNCGGEPMQCPEPAHFDELPFVEAYPVFNGYSTFVNVGTLSNFGLYLPTCGVDISFRTSVSNDQMCAVGLTDISGKHLGFGLEFNTGINMSYQRYSICFWIRDYDGNTSRCALDASQVYDDRWHTFSIRVLQLENAKFKIKIDGRTHETSAAIPGAMTNRLLAFQSPVGVGCHFDRGRKCVRMFNGAIRNVTLWQCIIESKVDTPIASWKLDDGPGARVAVDSSGYMNHGIYQIYKKPKMHKIGSVDFNEPENTKALPGHPGAASQQHLASLGQMQPLGFVWQRFLPPAGDETDLAMKAAGGGAGGDGSGGGSSGGPRKSFANNVLKAACVAVTTLVTESGNAKEVVIDLMRDNTQKQQQSGGAGGPAFEPPDDFPFELLRDSDTGGRCSDDRRIVRPLPSQYFTKITTTNYGNMCREALHRFDAYAENAHMVFQLCIGDSIFTVCDLLGMKRSHLAVFNPVALSWRDVISTVGDAAKQRTVLSRSTQAAEKALLDIGSKPQLFKKGQLAIPTTRVPGGDIVADVLAHALLKGTEPSSLFVCEVVASTTAEDNIRYTALWTQRLLKTDRTNATIVLQKAFRAILARRRFRKLDQQRRARLAHEYHNTMTRKQCPRECEHRNKNKIALLVYAGSFDKSEVQVISTTDASRNFTCEAEVPPIDFTRDKTQLTSTLEELGYKVTIYEKPAKDMILDFVKDLQPKMHAFEIQLTIFICGYYISVPRSLEELEPSTSSQLLALADEQTYERKLIILEFKRETVDLYKEFGKSYRAVKEIIEEKIADINKKITALSKKKKKAAIINTLKEDIAQLEKGIDIKLYTNPLRVLPTSWTSCDEKSRVHLYRTSDFGNNNNNSPQHKLSQSGTFSNTGSDAGGITPSKSRSFSKGGGDTAFGEMMQAEESFGTFNSKNGGANTSAAFVPFLEEEEDDEDELLEHKHETLALVCNCSQMHGATATEITEYLPLKELELVVCGSMPRRGHHGIFMYDLQPFIHSTRADVPKSGIVVSSGEVIRLTHPNPNCRGWFSYYLHRGIRGSAIEAMRRGKRPVAPYIDVETMQKYLELHAEKYPDSAKVDEIKYWGEYLGDIFFASEHLTTKELRQKVHSQNKPTNAVIRIMVDEPDDTFMQSVQSELGRLAKTSKSIDIKRSAFIPELRFVCDAVALKSLLEHPFALEHTCARFITEAKKHLSTGVSHEAQFSFSLQGPQAVLKLCIRAPSDKYDLASSLAPGAFTVPNSPNFGGIADPKERCFKYAAAAEDVRCRVEETLIPFWREIRDSGVLLLTGDDNDDEDHYHCPAHHPHHQQRHAHFGMNDSVANRSVSELLHRKNTTVTHHHQHHHVSFAGALPSATAAGGGARGALSRRPSSLGGLGGGGSRRGSFVGAVKDVIAATASATSLAPISPLPLKPIFSFVQMELALAVELGENDARNLDRAARLSPAIGKIGTLLSCVVVPEKAMEEVADHESFMQKLDQIKAAEARHRAAKEAELRRQIIDKYEALIKKATEFPEIQGRAVATGKVSRPEDVHMFFAHPLQSAFVGSAMWVIKNVFGARNGSLVRSLIDNGMIEVLRKIMASSPLVAEKEVDPREEDLSANPGAAAIAAVASSSSSTSSSGGGGGYHAPPVRVHLVKLASAAISLPPLACFCEQQQDAHAAKADEEGLCTILVKFVLPVLTTTLNRGPRVEKDEYRSVAQIAASLLTNSDANCKEVSEERSPATEALIQAVACWSVVLLFDASRQKMEDTESVVTDRGAALQAVPTSHTLLALVAAGLSRIVGKVADVAAAAAAAAAPSADGAAGAGAVVVGAAGGSGGGGAASKSAPPPADSLDDGSSPVSSPASAASPIDEHADEEHQNKNDTFPHPKNKLLWESTVAAMQDLLALQKHPDASDPRSVAATLQLWCAITTAKQQLSSPELVREGTELQNTLTQCTSTAVVSMVSALVQAAPCRETFAKLKKDAKNSTTFQQLKEKLKSLPDMVRGQLAVLGAEYSV